jgi:hypothetical protein
MNTRFLISIFLSNAQSSSFQRGNVYARNATNNQKRAFQEDFRKRLREFEQRYKQPVSEEDHIRTIQEFADQLSYAHPNALANGRLRIGTAQKAVNLFLKFLWSIGLVPEPPHCPIDRIVLTEIRNNQNWTELDNIEDYKAIIGTIRQLAGQRTPAQWEYDLWNRKAQQQGGVYE